MELLRHDAKTRRWLSSALTDEVSLAPGAAELVPLEQGAVPVCAPGVRALVGGRGAVAVVLVGESEFSVEQERFRVRVGSGLVARSFEAGAAPTVCARCKLGLRGSDVVMSCGCGALLHEGAPANGGEALLCFSYAPTCPCGRSRAELEGSDEEGSDD